MDIINEIHAWVWGAPLLILVIGVGLYLTVILRGLQFRYLFYGLKLAFGFEGEQKGRGDLSHFESLMTALAATVGIGNIAGVATALTVGGPGALFWMWVTALLGMALKYAEALLALKYREKDKKGEMCGGPMQFIEKGLKIKPLAISFALFGMIASFGGGNMLQANSIADLFSSSLAIDPFLTGVVLALVSGAALIGGIKSIGKVSGLLVPLMALIYVGGALVVIGLHYDKIIDVIVQIFYGAFSTEAYVGGFAGTTLMLALQTGVARGLMTSEAGLGTASIAAAAAKSDHPGRQAMVSMTGSFLATIILCSITALVLGVTGVGGRGITGAALTWSAFEGTIPFGGLIVTISLVLFGFTTLLGWAYYGEKCAEYLFGERFVSPFRLIFCLVIVLGAILELEVVWKVSDITNALMAFPNLIALFALSREVVKETRHFLGILSAEKLSNPYTIN